MPAGTGPGRAGRRPPPSSIGDGFVYGPDHAFSTSQSLGSVWPLAGILGSGVALGPVGAALSGIAIGLCRVAAVVVNGAPIDSGGKILSLTNTVVFYALGGAAAGYLARLLRRAEKEISAARAREEVARTLHDGVLQTLAIVERRATDPALARMAREQERELREYLFGAARATAGATSADTDVGPPLRAAAARCEDHFGSRVQVRGGRRPPRPPPGQRGRPGRRRRRGHGERGQARRGGARSSSTSSRPTAGACSARSRTTAPASTPPPPPRASGSRGSIRGRMAEVGGRVEVRSAPGQGTEVLLWLP